MYSLSSVSCYRSNLVLFENASCQIHSGYRVGVVGRNGSGKSSLFAMMSGKLEVETGELSIPPNTAIATVLQHTPDSVASALDYVLDGDEELRTIEAAIEQAALAEENDKLAQLYAKLEAIDGYNARVRAAQLLQGLGFDVEQQQLPVNSFSGGWRMRLNLGQALMCRSDLLLLDEPTNHLDLDAALWLEEWLTTYRGTLMLISHDRDFLDKICDHIIHIENKQLNYYTGNYSAFEKMRAEKLAQQQSAFEKQQREVKHIQSFIDRFKAKASKAKQAQSRIKALEKMELIGPAHIDSPFTFQFKKPDKVPDPLIKIEQAEIGYGDKTIIADLDFHLVPEDRIGVLGHNGAGKSTLMKLLAGELTAFKGEIFRSPNLKIGYFAQHQLEQLQLDQHAIYHVQQLNKQESEQNIRDFLGSFGFDGDNCFKPVGVFSGGEKSRLALALIVYQKPNLLILDEPTNHLDIEMRFALVSAIQEFEGALIVVSHDRYLLTAVTDRFYLVNDGKCDLFKGDLDDYRQALKLWKEQQLDASGSKEKIVLTSRKEQRQQQAEFRKKLQPLNNEIKQLELTMDKLNHKKDLIHAELSDEACYLEHNKQKLTELLKEQAELDTELADIEERWMTCSEELEVLKASLCEE